MKVFDLPSNPVNGTTYFVRLCVCDAAGAPVQGIRSYLTFAKSNNTAGESDATHANALTSAEGCVILPMKVNIAPGSPLVVLTGLDGQGAIGTFPVALTVQ
jgi:hypothetical protein